MILLIYISVYFLFCSGSEKDVKPESMGKDELIDHVNYDKREVESMKQQKVFLKQQSKMRMEERDWKFGKQQEEPSYIAYMKFKNETSEVTECKNGFSCIQFSYDMEEYFESLGQNDLNKLGTISTKPAYDQTLTTYAGATKNLGSSSKKLSAYILKFNDPLWEKQWYLQDYRTSNMPVMDHNVVPVLNMRVTGKEVTVAIVGEGIRNHPDLGNRFDNTISFDFCTDKPGARPFSDYYFSGMYYAPHGTSNAGVIAMQGGNGICGVGIAPDARIVAYKIVNCDTMGYRPALLAERALKYQLHLTDIYCNIWLNYNWMSDKEGEKLFVPSSQIINVFKKGVSEGRQNRGAIYIFPSGLNRGKSNCASNGYLNNPYVITIASARQDGTPASYSERCTAVFATAYSGETGYEGIVSIDTSKTCTTSYFTGIPAGPAIASGIIALTLEANPSLTYRDVMHIIAMTAEVAPLANNVDTWNRNGRGFWVSSDFGFGLLNAENMVLMAKHWQKVPDQQVCLLRKHFASPLSFSHTQSQEIVLDGSVCNGGGSDITYLEHVQLELTVDYPFRGAISINLMSPAGTVSKIMEPRIRDFTREGYKGWEVTSLHHWGENPKGLWKITISALEIYGEKNPFGSAHEFILKLYGTQRIPGNYPRKYAAFRLPDGRKSHFI